jgi:transposase
MLVLPCGAAGRLSIRLPQGITLPGRLMEVRLNYGSVEIVCEIIDQARDCGPTIGIDLGVNTVIAATDGEKALLVSGREIKATIQLRNKRRNRSRGS